MGNSDRVRDLPTLAYQNVEKKDKTEAKLENLKPFPVIRMHNTELANGCSRKRILLVEKKY
jgi:hypothetical protein